ncbi:MAG: lipopolysaccharide heptosyltransferase II [Candidatus Omnitrophica bacterium]|jgi:heptosyltransferase-2|nr:lipopolysaccharide heptosyltransferase II [Candidatus Omnitrophota bacterium]MDD4981257.1 lipopolysaccharide heptosyltransferase II [Candidatus Omnitrophota bacterium]
MAEKILFITLNNIGDCILALPVLDALRGIFPKGHISVLSSKRAQDLFLGNPAVDKFILYDKRIRIREKLRLFRSLNKENFDLVVDLRNSLMGFIFKVKVFSMPFLRIPGSIRHMRDRHLCQLRRQGAIPSAERYFCTSFDDGKYIESLLVDAGINSGDNYIVISAGSLSQAKRWPKERFAELAARLIKEFKVKIILVGEKTDQPLNQHINSFLSGVCLDLSGKTNLRELAYLLKKARLVVSNDSAVMHMASYLDVPTVAIFGKSDDTKYGPWSRDKVLVKKEIFCRPCQKAQCLYGNLRCLSLVKVEDVLRAVRKILLPEEGRELGPALPREYKRILVVRTDRIGDVLLSTPVIKVLRDNYPHAFIAVMVSPYSKEIVDENPYLDEVVLYDKDAKEKGWFSSIKFARKLSRSKFDLAIILHPTNRVHLIAYLAGIPKRIGYDRKMGFLLTDKFSHKKQLGQKHELEYNLDLLKDLGLKINDKSLFMPIRPASEEWAADFLKLQGIKEIDRLLLINPAASCPSKIWPANRFAEAADRLVKRYGLKVIIVCGPKDILIAENVLAQMKAPAYSLAGKVSLSQLASLLKRSVLFISNDSGPVHIASALGVAVISIFGRKQSGLSPRRWGPVGLRDKVLHKDVGCLDCLAHNCKKDFACLKAITVEDVLEAADTLLKVF